jgi:DNA-binding cell septation regulator SpoVG
VKWMKRESTDFIVARSDSIRCNKAEYRSAAHPVCQNTRKPRKRDAFIWMHMIRKGQMKTAHGTHPSSAEQFYCLGI